MKKTRILACLPAVLILVTLAGATGDCGSECVEITKIIKDGEGVNYVSWCYDNDNCGCAGPDLSFEIRGRFFDRGSGWMWSSIEAGISGVSYSFSSPGHWTKLKVIAYCNNEIVGSDEKETGYQPSCTMLDGRCCEYCDGSHKIDHTLGCGSNGLCCDNEWADGDEDDDGKNNCYDACSGTPEGCTVDGNGCTDCGSTDSVYCTSCGCELCGGLCKDSCVCSDYPATECPSECYEFNGQCLSSCDTLTACGDTCCNTNEECCGDTCCNTNEECCGEVCCDTNEECCGEVCCDTNEECCDGVCKSSCDFCSDCIIYTIQEDCTSCGCQWCGETCYDMDECEYCCDLGFDEYPYCSGTECCSSPYECIPDSDAGGTTRPITQHECNDNSCPEGYSCCLAPDIMPLASGDELTAKIELLGNHIMHLGETAHFTSSGSSQGSHISYHWDFGDGSTSQEDSPQHAFNTGGRFNVVLKVSNLSDSVTDNEHITVLNYTLPKISDFKVNPAEVFSGGTVKITATITCEIEIFKVTAEMFGTRLGELQNTGDDEYELIAELESQYSTEAPIILKAWINSKTTTDFATDSFDVKIISEQAAEEEESTSSSLKLSVGNVPGELRRGESVLIQAFATDDEDNPVSNVTVYGKLPDGNIVEFENKGGGNYQYNYTPAIDEELGVHTLSVWTDEAGTKVTTDAEIEILGAELTIDATFIPSPDSKGVYEKGDYIDYVLVSLSYSDGSAVDQGTVSGTFDAAEQKELVFENIGDNEFKAWLNYTLRKEDIPYINLTLNGLDKKSNEGENTEKLFVIGASVEDVFSLSITKPVDGSSYALGQEVPFNVIPGAKRPGITIQSSKVSVYVEGSDEVFELSGNEILKGSYMVDENDSRIMFFLFAEASVSGADYTEYYAVERVYVDVNPNLVISVVEELSDDETVVLSVTYSDGTQVLDDVISVYFGDDMVNLTKNNEGYFQTSYAKKSTEPLSIKAMDSHGNTGTAKWGEVIPEALELPVWPFVGFALFIAVFFVLYSFVREKHQRQVMIGRRKQNLKSRRDELQNLISRTKHEFFKRHIPESEANRRITEYEEELKLVEEKMRQMGMNEHDTPNIQNQPAGGEAKTSSGSATPQAEAKTSSGSATPLEKKPEPSKTISKEPPQQEKPAKEATQKTEEKEKLLEELKRKLKENE